MLIRCVIGVGGVIGQGKARPGKGEGKEGDTGLKRHLVDGGMHLTPVI